MDIRSPRPGPWPPFAHSKCATDPQSALISISVEKIEAQLGQTPAYSARLRIRDSASRGVPVYTSVFARRTAPNH